MTCLILLCFSLFSFFVREGFYGNGNATCSYLTGDSEPLPRILAPVRERKGDGCGSITTTTDFSQGKPAAGAGAGDRKLGFSSIKFINMPKRFDRADAATLQAYLSGLDLEYHPAVEPSDIDIHDVGMPPSSNQGALKPGEKGCWRAHANVSKSNTFERNEKTFFTDIC